MTIISTTMTKTAQEQTENGIYQLEYVIHDEVLERVLVNILDATTSTDPQIQPTYIGTITYERGNVYCSMPYNSGMNLFMADFEIFMERIKQELPASISTPVTPGSEKKGEK